MNINCNLENYTFLNGKRYYTCIILSQYIPENTKLNLYRITDFENKPDSEVEAVMFRGCETYKVPQGLTKTFPNLKVLHIIESELEIVAKDDLAEYKNLEYIGFMFNSIQIIPGDCFEGFENLNLLQINGNDVKVIEPNVLDGLDKLEVADFRDGDKYTKCYSIHENIPSNGTLDDVKNEIFTRYYKHYKKIGNLFKYESENKILKGSIEILNYRLEKQEIQMRDLEQKLIRSEKVQKIFNIQKKLDEVKAESVVVKEPEVLHEIPTSAVIDIKNLLQTDESFKDLNIVIEGREFPVHKVLVAARSPTLAELLKSNPKVKNLNLIDITTEAFEKILKFFYTNELPGTLDVNFTNLFAAAGKLKIDEVKEYAASKLIDMIDEKNAMDVYKYSSTYGGVDLMQKSFKIVKKIHPQIPFEDSWSRNGVLVMKIIQAYHIREYTIKRAEEEFDRLIMESKSLN